MDLFAADSGRDQAVGSIEPKKKAAEQHEGSKTKQTQRKKGCKGEVGQGQQSIDISLAALAGSLLTIVLFF